ncbi:hypothetical protein Tco_1087738 [Tanacetum coccineum]
MIIQNGLIHGINDAIKLMLFDVINAKDKAIPLASKSNASPTEREKNTYSAINEANLKNDLVDLMGIDVVEKYHKKKLLYDKYCDKILKRRKSAEITNLITEYLVKINKKARILELKRRHLKIIVLISNTPYPSRKIRRICACTSLKTTREQDPIRRI